MEILAASNAWSLDVVFFGLLLIGLFAGVAGGFVRGVCKIAGTVFALVVAFFFCTQVCALFENWFGLTTLIANAVKSETLAYWLCVIISFIALTVVVKLLSFLIGKIGKALVEKSKALSVIDRLLGGILGLVEMLFLLMGVMVIFKWLAIVPVDTFISESFVVSKIYFGGWLEWIMASTARIFTIG